MNGLVETTLPALRPILDMFFRDSTIAADVTYKRFIRNDLDPVLKRNVPTYEDTPLRAIFVVKELKAKEVKSVAAILLSEKPETMESESYFMFRFVGFPVATSTEDLVIGTNGVAYNVERIKPIHGLVYMVKVKSYV